MFTFRKRAVIAVSALALSAGAAGGVVAATQSSDEAALQPSRPAADQSIETKVSDLLSQMTLEEKLSRSSCSPTARCTRRRTRARRASAAVFSLTDPEKINQLQHDRRRAVAAAHPDPVRLRHDPRVPDDLPDPARRGQLVRSRASSPTTTDRRARVGGGRAQADLQPDGRRLARAALGPHLRGRRRGSVPRLGLRRRAREGRAGQRLQRARQGRHQRQALRGLRPAGGRARLQHDRHVRAAAAQPLPAAVQGRDRRGRRHGDVLVQRDQRRPGLREPLHRDRHPQEGVGLRRLHRERLHRGRRAAGLPAEAPDDGSRAATASPPTGPTRPRWRSTPARTPRWSATFMRDYGRQLLVRSGELSMRAARRRRAADPARQVPRGAVRPPVRRPGQGRRRAAQPDAVAGRARRGRQLDGAAQERRRARCRSTRRQEDRGDRPARRRASTTCSARGGAAATTTTPSRVLDGIKAQSTGTTTFAQACTLGHKEPPDNDDPQRVRRHAGFAAAVAAAQARRPGRARAGRVARDERRGRGAHRDRPARPAAGADRRDQGDRQAVRRRAVQRPPADARQVADDAPAILEAWFPGVQAGNAVADVAVRQGQPRRQAAGLVPAPRRPGADLLQPRADRAARATSSSKYNSRYRDLTSCDPLYPFGYGLSYTTFDVSNLQLSSTTVPRNGQRHGDRST